MIILPFGFLAGAAGGGPAFDPTLGGTLSPYFWYDFTDSSTMTFSSGNNIEAIASKGTNTGDLAKGGSGFAKYTTNWIAPTWEGDYTQFYGNSGGTLYNSSLSRAYSSDGTQGNNDYPFYNDNAVSVVTIYEVDFTAITTTNLWYLVSVKGRSGISSPGFDEFGPLVANVWSSLSFTFQWLSTDTSKAPSAGMSGLRSSNQIGVYSYNGVTPSSTGWSMQMYSHDAVGGISNGDIYREVPEVANFANRLRSTAGVSGYENLTVGSRSRDNVTQAAPFKLKHLLVYDINIDSTNYGDLLLNYKAAFPGDNINSVIN